MRRNIITTKESKIKLNKNPDNSGGINHYNSTADNSAASENTVKCKTGDREMDNLIIDILYQQQSSRRPDQSTITDNIDILGQFS